MATGDTREEAGQLDGDRLVRLRLPGGRGAHCPGQEQQLDVGHLRLHQGQLKLVFFYGGG